MENKNMFERYAALLQEKRYRELRELLAEENEVDLAEFIEGLTQEQAVLAFRMLPKGLAAEVFSNLPPEVQQNIVTSVTDQELSEIVEDLFLDDAVDMLEELPANVVKRVLKQARPETRRLINQFLQYPENSVGSIMTAEFVDLKKDTTAGEAIQRSRKVGEDCEAIYTCYVTDSQRVLKGVITLRELLLADENQPVGENMETDIVTVQTTDDPAVLLKAHDGEAHHLGTAARHSGAAGQTRQAQDGADGGGGDGQRQRHTHQHGHQNAHQEGLQLSGPHDELTEGAGHGADGRRDDPCGADADEGGDDGRHQNIDFGFLADGLAALSGDDGNEQHRQRAAGLAQGIAGVAHGSQGEQHQRRRLESVSDGNGHGRAAHEGGHAADGIAHAVDLNDFGGEEADVELTSDGVQNRADQQRAEQALSHGAQSVDAVPLGGDDDVFAFQECLDFFQG